jgi:SAM-dependent methyltransferase
MAEHQQDQHPHWDDLTEMIELEAEALRDLTDTVTEWVAGTVATPPRHLLDLGSGTGAGTFALLRRFPDARVTAVDSSPQMLARLERLGLEQSHSSRLAVVRADLDDGLPRIDGVDLVWASSVVHHLNHPARLLAQVAALLPVGGWFVVVEAEDVPWFLPDDLGIGRPGLERRCHELLAEHRDAQLPNVGSDWGARLTTAGFTEQTAKVFEAEVPPPLPEAAIRYAQRLFRMLREVERDRLDTHDVTVLDVLLNNIDPRGLARRQDLTLRAIRKTWAAQRPERRDAL